MFFHALKFLTDRSDVGVPEIVESICLVEIVEFAEFAEIVEICGIVVKLAIRNFNGGLGVAARIECADAFCFSETNKNFHRDGFLITCHMFEHRYAHFRVSRSTRGICGISTNSTNSTEIPQIPQITAVFGECYNRVRRAGLRVVAASLFLQDLNFFIVASAVTFHNLWNLWNLWNFHKLH